MLYGMDIKLVVLLYTCCAHPKNMKNCQKFLVKKLFFIINKIQYDTLRDCKSKYELFKGSSKRFLYLL